MILIAFFLCAGSLQGNIDDSINRAIQFDLSGQPLAAKDILQNLLQENITEDERACILYNLATLAIQDKNFDNAVIYLQELHSDINNKPFFTYSVMKNFAIALIEQAERDLTLYQHGNRSFNIGEQLQQTIDAAKQKLAIAREAAVKLNDKSRVNALRLLNLKANSIEILYASEIKQQRAQLISQPSIIAFLEALSPFKRDLFVLVKNKNSDTNILQSEKQALLKLTSIFFAKLFQTGIPDRFLQVNKKIANCKNTTQLLQEMLFLEFQIKCRDSQIDAIQGLYEADLLGNELRDRQIEMRKEYLLSLPSTFKNKLLTKSLNEKINRLHPKELLIYATAFMKQTDLLFLELLENQSNNRFIEDALADRLSGEGSEQAKKALDILGTPLFSEKKLYQAFTTYNFEQAVRYEISKILQEGLDSKTIPFLLESLQTELSNTIVKSRVELLSEQGDLKPLVFRVNLNWLLAHVEKNTISLQQLLLCAQEDVSFMQQLATSSQIPYKDIVSLEEKSMKQGLERYVEGDGEFKYVLQPLIDQYSEILQEKEPVPLKIHLELAEKSADLLKKIEDAKRRKQQNVRSSNTPQQERTSPTNAIEAFQEMHTQDMPFAPKEATQQKEKVARPW